MRKSLNKKQAHMPKRGWDNGTKEEGRKEGEEVREGGRDGGGKREGNAQSWLQQ